MSNISEYGSSFALWSEGAEDAWRGYTRHAFVKGIGDGTLPRSSFLHYLAQDYVFLIHFSRAWAMAIVKAETQEEMRLSAGMVDALVNFETKLHVELCKREGISEDELFNVAEEPANLAYTRYVMDAGISGDFLELIAALAPCVFGYGQIGLELSKTKVEGNQYQEWIDTYASAEYQEVCTNTAKMIDNAIKYRLGDDAQNLPIWSRLQERFTMATKLEIDFWQIGLDAGKGTAA